MNVNIYLRINLFTEAVTDHDYIAWNDWMREQGGRDGCDNFLECGSRTLTGSELCINQRVPDE
jgi:hypothetical protein